ncbi:MAG: translational GTPase TypA [Candidatus Krumholzibacteria bacterium]|nr:translational GTPase TypA [Candidatus Krumholzibacteria bacterium]
MPNQKRRKDVRNIAIIAHVDHGKTTLVDALLKQTGAHTFREGETTIMDSNPLERERGITIFSKNASFTWRDTHFNIVDTPGHADFGSEVERILKMVDGVLLLVDAFEGPMPQTKFVLKKSLELHLKPLVVINKLDRPSARPKEVADMTFDLFCELNATDEQLDFPIVYASGKDGYARLEVDDTDSDMTPLLDTMLHRVLPPLGDVDRPFQMLVTMLDYDNYVGRIGVGRIFHGRITPNEPIVLVRRDGKHERGRVTKILKHRGLLRVEVDMAMAGDIVALAGMESVKVGSTLAAPENPEMLPMVTIDEPTISMNFAHNTSPLAGKDGGRFLTSRHLRERLAHEAMVNVGVRVEETAGGDRFKVSGRGELHLSILIETMRREGYELEVSRPEVILKTADDEVLEPVEEVVVEVDPDFQGPVMQAIGERKGEVTNITMSAVGTARLEFYIATRALIGFRSEFLMMTRGTGIMYQNFYQYQKYKGEMPKRQVGVMVSMSGGQAVAYALWGLQERGEIFACPGQDLYEGMIVGANNKGGDMVVNAVREKKLTNIRAAGSDEAIQLTPPREMTLEFALEFIGDDELVEITPKNIRLRKLHLRENDRRQAAKRG